MRGKVASWWLPDDVVFIEQMPMTATGKIHKLTLRERFKDYKLAERRCHPGACRRDPSCRTLRRQREAGCREQVPA